MEDIMNAEVVDMVDSGNYDLELMDALNMNRMKILDGNEIEIDKFLEAKEDLKAMVLGTYKKTEGLLMLKIYPFDQFVPPSL
jgi:hypothetical protein